VDLKKQKYVTYNMAINQLKKTDPELIQLKEIMDKGIRDICIN
jgi:hypothetical protein